MTSSTLEGADLTGSNMDGAKMELAILKKANLNAVRFTNARDMTWNEVLSATNWQQAYLPDYLLNNPPRSSLIHMSQYDFSEIIVHLKMLRKNLAVTH